MTIAIIGNGRVGGALAQRSGEAGTPSRLFGRGEDWAQLESDDGPIVIATRNDDLDDVVSQVPRARHGDLVFVQNGMLRPWLAKRGLEGCTRGLLFFAVAERGAPIAPGGASPFFGPHAETIVSWFERMGLEAEAVTVTAFAALELEKLLWNCIFGLLCEVHDEPVGEIVARRHDEVRTLVEELCGLGAPALGVDVDLDALTGRLCAYSDSIPDYQGAVKELKWRNGWFVELAEAAPEGAAPLHARLLASV